MEEILTHKIDKHGDKPKYKYLVQWLGFSSADDQWVDEDDFADHGMVDKYHERCAHKSPARGRRRKQRKV